MAGRIGRSIYRSLQWESIRRKVLKRDGHRCKKCGRMGRLEVDHIVPIAKGGEAFAMPNLRTLCRHCHLRITGQQNRKEVSPERAAWNRLVDAL